MQFFFSHLCNQREVDFEGKLTARVNCLYSYWMLQDKSQWSLVHWRVPFVHLNIYAVLYVGCVYSIGLLEMMYAIWCCWDIVSSHVLMHLRETLLDVVLCAAFSHCGKSESLWGMVQLQERRKKHRCFYSAFFFFTDGEGMLFQDFYYFKLSSCFSNSPYSCTLVIQKFSELAKIINYLTPNALVKVV